MKKLGFGTARLPLVDSNVQSGIDMEQLCNMVDIFLEKGFTYFDTAYMYHDHMSEVAIRETLVRRYARDRFVLADKLPLYLGTKMEQEGVFQRQLKNCGVDYFDIYLLHAVTDRAYQAALRLRSFDFLKKKKREGKVKHIGMSYHGSAELLDEILTLHPELEYVQLLINYLDWEDGVVQSRRCYETVRKHGCKVIVMEPVKAGALAEIPMEAEKLLKSYRSDLSVPSWAIRYAASLEGVEVVLSGMSSKMQMEDNLSYMEKFQPLDAMEYRLISQAVEMIKKDRSIPCTSCQLCIEQCPVNIPIPEYFALYNSHCRHTYSVMSSEMLIYQHYFIQKGKASECVGCGLCEQVCPNQLPIKDWMKKVAGCMEKREETVSEEVMKKKEKELSGHLMRTQKKFDLLHQWMRLKQRGISLTEFFDDQHYTSVAIYGGGDLGILLHEELSRKQGLVKCILDKNAKKIQLQGIDIPVCHPTDCEVYPVDVVMVTPVLVTDEIEDMIQERFPGQLVLELEEVLYELYRKHEMKAEMWGL